MSTPKKKFYVVWEGKTPGIYRSWAECQAVTNGHPGAKYKAFPTLESAKAAFEEGPAEHWGTGKFVSALSPKTLVLIGDPVPDSLCVDAALNTNTHVMEYRGVWYRDRTVAFQEGPFESNTVNIGEFLALVHALTFFAERSLNSTIYSDSQTALAWVKKQSVNSKPIREGQIDKEVHMLTTKALRWLDNNKYSNAILKWNTEAWGENPADYGRK